MTESDGGGRLLAFFQQLAQSRSPKDIAGLLASVAAEVAPYSMVSLFFCRESASGRPALDWICNLLAAPEKPEAPLLDPSLVHEILAKGRAYHQSKAGQLLVPLLAAGNPLGLIVIHLRKGSEEMAEAGLPLLDNLAAPLAIAFDNARLYSGLQANNAALRYHVRFTQNILDAMTGGILAVTLRREILLFNRNARLIFGVEEGPVVGKNFRAILPAPTAALVEQLCEEALTHGHVPARELSFEGPDHFELSIEASGSLVKEEGSPIGVVLHFRHLATSRRLAQLEEMDKLKNRFIRTVSHELRNPLSPIGEAASLLLDGMAGDLPPGQREMIEIIHRNAKYLTSLINDLLDLNRLMPGRARLDLFQADICKVLREVALRFTVSAEMHSFKFSLKLPDQPVEATMDSIRVEQVVVNLLTNAFKFTPDGGAISMELEADADRARITVRDSGEGIAPEDQKRIFDMFEQVGRHRPGRPRGSGLGLSICKEVADAHQGTLTLVSAPGEGSAFTLEIPRKGPTTEEIKPATEPAKD